MTGPFFREYMMILIHKYEAENEVRFNLYQFDNGETLIEEFNKDKDYFDLFFLDNHLCGITGLETALYIRRNNRECQIVFATASDELDTFMVVSPLQILSKSYPLLKSSTCTNAFMKLLFFITN